MFDVYHIRHQINLLCLCLCLNGEALTEDTIKSYIVILPYVEENSVSAVAVNSIKVADPQLEGLPKTPLRQNYSNFMDISENSGKNNK